MEPFRRRRRAEVLAARISESVDWGREVSTVKVIADLCVVPLGKGVSVSREVAACQRVLRDAGLKIQLHAYGTNIEGEWEDVFGAIRRCHEVVHEMGAPRISTTIKLGTRTDRGQSMEDKIRSVEEKMD
jgi:uncharacterized protein (TIGR00106 family)